MQNLNRGLLKRTLMVILVVAVYLLILRGAISFFHPKLGELLVLVNYVGGEDAMFWVLEHVSAPSYDFLANSIWGSPIPFFSLLLSVFSLAVFLTKPKVRDDSNA